MSTILVVGASGTVGSSLVSLLIAAGHTVRRGTSRAPEAADQVHIDLAQRQGLEQALSGVDGAFLLSPPGHANQHELLNPFIDAAGKHHVRKIVLMTAMGADADESSPFRKAERHLESSGLAYNIIRPNWFMQNFETFWLQPILEQGKILLPAGTAKGSFIDARDIASVAAALLTSAKHDNQAFDLTGSGALDHDQVASIISRESGRAVEYVDIPPDALRTPLVQAGLSPDYVNSLLVILGFFKLGYAERVTDAVKQITGSDARLFAAYARERRAVWAPAAS